MTALQQMGHHSENLIYDRRLGNFAGAVLSPVNYSHAEVTTQIQRAGAAFQTVFDPQLYFPRSERGKLKQWSYFPRNFDSLDITSESWWNKILEDICYATSSLGPTFVCSPAVVPKSYSADYFSFMVRTGNSLRRMLGGTGVQTMQTALVGLADLATPHRSLELASILSRSDSEWLYLIFLSEVEPRRELRDTEELKGAMQLISSLEAAGMRTLVGFTSSDMVLWKAAGASACATGKFFNLRRFTRSRFEEPSQGGGQLPYWFEESLMAFLRETDVLRLLRTNRLGAETLNNPFSVEILDTLENRPDTAWLRTSWRQHLFAFADLESRISNGKSDPEFLLTSAERAWIDLEDNRILMEEPRNDGGWLRSWRRALVEYGSK